MPDTNTDLLAHHPQDKPGFFKKYFEGIKREIEHWSDNEPKPIIKIDLIANDPQYNTPQYNNQLKKFLTDQFQRGIKYWSHDDYYTFSNGTQFQFTYDMLQRVKKHSSDKLSESPIENQICYEILSHDEKVESKSLGTIIPSLATMNYKHNNYVTRDKSRIVQIKQHEKTYYDDDLPLNDESDSSLIYLDLEFGVASNIPHLHIKTPVITTEAQEPGNHLVKHRDYQLENKEAYEKKRSNLNPDKILALSKPSGVFEHARKRDTLFPSTSYTTMKKLPGKDLQQIIGDDKKNHPLSVEQRYALTIGILEAYLNQVAQNKIAHLNIEPSNIMVNLPTMQIHYINYALNDYALDVPYGIKVLRGGNCLFKAPELKKISDLGDPFFRNYASRVCLIAQEKNDVFSLGRTIAQLWHVSPKTYVPVAQHKETECTNNHINMLENLFEDIAGLSDDTKASIKRTLEKMLAIDANQRINVGQALEEFSALNKSTRNICSPGR